MLSLNEKLSEVQLKRLQATFHALPLFIRGGSLVACLNFKTSLVSVYKCLSLLDGFTFTVAIWPREVVSCRDFILRAVASFWAMSLVGIYPGRASIILFHKTLQLLKKQLMEVKLFGWCTRIPSSTKFFLTQSLNLKGSI